MTHSNGTHSPAFVGENAGTPDSLAFQLKSRKNLLKIINFLSKQRLDLEINPLLNQVLQLTVETLESTSGYIGDWNENDKSSTMLAEYFSEHASHLERVSDLGKTYDIVEDFPSYERWLFSEDKFDIIHVDDTTVDPKEIEHLVENGAKSALTIPLILQHETVGYIEIWESRYHREFTKEEIEFLQTVGQAVGKSILNAQLFNALHESAEQNRLIMDASPEPIIIYNRFGQTTYINPAFVETFGWETDDVFGKQIDFVPEDKKAEIQASIAQVVAGEKQVFLNTQRLTKDGRKLDVMISNAVFRDKDGNIDGSISIFRDVTQLRQAEAERERSLAAERRQRLLAETLRDVTLALTSQTRQEQVLAEILKQVQRLVPYEAAQIALIQDGNVHIVYTNGYSVAEGRPLIANLIQPIATFPTDLKVIESKQPLIISNTHDYPGWVITNETAWIRSYLVAPIVLRNEVVGLVRLDGMQFNQFTELHGRRLMPLAGAAAIALENARLLAEEQQRAEELAQARDEALEASRLKSTLLANVSHELRTPLGAVIGYAEMLYLGIFGDVTAEQAAIASEIVESGTYLTHMVNNLLDQAQLESGRFAIDIAPFNASDLFEPVEAQLQLLAHKKGLTLTFGIDQNVPPRLFGAQDRLQQIVINLAANAIKFTENGGISVRLIRTNKTFWGIQVSDTGVGISAELQQKIFQPFEQLDNSTTRQQSGSGLGLSIVQQLTDLMGGYITLKSDLGFGSVFTAHFPLTPNS